MNGWELAARSTAPASDGQITSPFRDRRIGAKRSLVADKDGDGHYDVIFGLSKVHPRLDTDAALHYLAQLIAAGDLVSIARRLVVIAYEDIGLANPPAVERAVTAVQAAERIGFEARIPLANAVIELCLSPKSNSAIDAIDAALARVNQGNSGAVPDHLKDAHYQGAQKLGRGVTYRYPHDYPEDWVAQQYLPDRIKTISTFSPSKTGLSNAPLPSNTANFGGPARSATSQR